MVTPSPDDRPAASEARSAVAMVQAYRQTRQQEWLATRRRVLRWVIRLGTAAFSIALLLPALALRTLTREVKTVAAGDALVYATGDRAGMPIETGTLGAGQAVQAFPQGKTDNERNLIELVRLSDELPAGLVAYSAICTHLGCTVLPKLTAEGYILCPCHGSEYDPARDAAVVRGPANRPLPGLPLTLSTDGDVVAAGGFGGPVGPI